MYSQCPDCLTRFRVTAASLRAAGGTVRCGRCGSAFDALARLSDTLPAVRPTADDGLAIGSVTAPPADYHFSADDLEKVFIDAREWQRQFDRTTERVERAEPSTAGEATVFIVEEPKHEDITLQGRQVLIETEGDGAGHISTEIVQLPKWAEEFDDFDLDSTRPLPVLQNVPGAERFDAEELEAEVEDAAVPDVATPEIDALANVAPEPPAVPGYEAAVAAPELASEGELPTGPGAQLADVIPFEPRPAARAVVPPPPEPLVETVSEAAVARLLEPEPAARSGAPAPLEPGTEPEPAPTAAPAEVTPAEAAPPQRIPIAERPWHTGERITAGAPAEQPAPARRASRWRAAGWALGTLLLALALLAQVLHQYRGDLVLNPAVGPLLERAYSGLGLAITPNWDPTAYELRQAAPAGLGAASGVLELRATITNRAAFAQPFPLLRVSIEDRYGSSLGERDFLPVDYLATPGAALQQLGAGQSVEASLSLVDPGPEAVGYRLDVCLRETDPARGSKVLRCSRGAG